MEITDKFTVGVDEAGRGPLVGPVVAAAVILDELIDGVTDSKKISEKKRFALANLIRQKAKDIGIGMASAKEIDTLNIHNATLLAMTRAIQSLVSPVKKVLIDGSFVPKEYSSIATSVVKGDQKVHSISAASIIAKTTRDSLLLELDEQYPQYGFKNHKGYPTKMHLEALEKYGVLDSHRTSYKPVQAILGKS